MQTIISYIDNSDTLKTWSNECDLLGNIIKSKNKKYNHSILMLDLNNIKQIRASCASKFNSLIHSDANKIDPLLTEKYFVLIKELDNFIINCDEVIAVTTRKIPQVKIRRKTNIKNTLKVLSIASFTIFILFSAVAWWLELGISYVQTEVCLGSQKAAVSALNDLKLLNY